MAKYKNINSENEVTIKGQASVAGTASSGEGKIYFKTDGKPYAKWEDETENLLLSEGGLNWIGETTDATQTEIFLNGQANLRSIVTANSTIGFTVYVSGAESGGEVKRIKIDGTIQRDGSNNTILVGSTTNTIITSTSGATAWDVDAQADDTNEALVIKVTGQAATTIKWSARAEVEELNF